MVALEGRCRGDPVMKKATMTALALISAVSWTPSASYAARGDDDRFGSQQRCEDAVTRKLRDAPGVSDVQLGTRPPEISQPSDHEVLVLGDGDYRTESRRHFSYSCTDNLRSGALGVEITPPPPLAKKNDNTGAAVAGVLIGAAVLAAIASNSKDDDRDRHGRRSFSPSDGITCYPREQSCYHDRGHRFSEKWTQRVYSR